MKPILFLLCLTLALPSVAQRFSTGLRTGASDWFSFKANTPDIVKSRNDWGWEQGLYLRYESQKRMAFEVDVAHYTFSPDNWWSESFESDCSAWGPAPVLLRNSERRNTIEYTLSGQYRITPASSKVKSYIGVNLSFATEYYKYSATYYYPESDQTYSYTDDGMMPNAFCGLSNYTSLTISPRLNVNSRLALKVNPFDAFSNFVPYHTGQNSKLTWNIGCGYTF